MCISAKRRQHYSIKAACLDTKLTILFALHKDFIMTVAYLHISLSATAI